MKKMKKTASVLLTILIIVLSIPLSAERAMGAAYNTPSQMANLVLFISFQDTDGEYWNLASGSKRKCEEIYDLYNVTDTRGFLSVKDYFEVASCGKFQIENIMPQMAEGNHTILPITLDNTTAAYNTGNEYTLLKDVVAKLNQNPEWLGKLNGNLDYDGNGYVDNVTFIVASPETGRDTNFYPHKSEAVSNELRINGVPMNCYNVINYERLHSVAGGAGVACHEFIHVLGPLDTYVICGDGTSPCGEGPVGCWDIMAETSAICQYPLAYTRQELGWINIGEASASGTYTLSSPQKDSNRYAMILKTPYSDTEFFVVEYRKQGSFNNIEFKDKIDQKIGGNGIIIYRVNTAAQFKSNLYSNYIYVFRQGEEETQATKVGARSAFLSLESGRRSFGSGDASVTSAANALTYTDGTNSGIIIKNVGAAGGDSITFDLEYAIDMTGKSWDSEQYRYVPVQNGFGMNTAILNGTIYGSNMKIAGYNGKLYGLSYNGRGEAELLRYTNGSWQVLRVLAQNSYDMDFEVGGDGLLYMVCSEGYTGLKIYSMNASETITDITGSISIQGSVANPKITLTSAGPAVAYRDWKNGDSIRAYLRKGTTWQALSTGGASGNMFQLCGNGDTLYLTAVHGNGNRVYYCNTANSKTFTGFGSEFSGNTVTGIDMVIDKYGVLYVAYYDSALKLVIVQGYQNGVWKQVGMNVCSQTVSGVQTVIDNETIYLAYQGDTTSGIKSHGILTSTGQPQTIPIQTVSLSQSSIGIQAGTTVNLQAFVYPQNTTQSKTISWSSSNPNVATVNQSGGVTAKSAGVATITAQAVNGVKGTCVVRVSGGTATQPSVSGNYTPTEAFVVRLYNMCLERQEESEGLAYWNQMLVSGTKSGAQVGYGFVFSDEYKNKHTSDEDYIEMLYQVFMNRPSDASGKNYWLGILNKGVSREYVFQGFAHSQEYTNICNSYGIKRGTVSLTQPRDKNPNLTAFVNRIYEKAMERQGEEDGLNYWCSMIQSGRKTPVQAAEYFLTSQEFRNKNLSNEAYIKVLYRTFMDRECDQAGLNYWLGELNRGCTREEVLRRFAGCPEFKNIITSFGL